MNGDVLFPFLAITLLVSPGCTRARNGKRTSPPLALWASLAVAALALAAAAPDPAAKRVDPAARLASQGSASEYWDLVARLDSNHSVFARFMITNQGPGTRTALAVGHLVQPDGTVVPFHNGRRWGRWKIFAFHAQRSWDGRHDITIWIEVISWWRTI